jgi:hypothetical protein
VTRSAVRPVHVRLVALPAVHMTASVLLRAPTAGFRQFRQRLPAGLMKLLLQPRRLGFGPHLSLPGTTALLLLSRGLLLLRHPLSGCHSGRVSADVADDLLAHMRLHQRRQNAVAKVRRGELGEGPRKSRCAGHLPRALAAAQPPQSPIAFEQVDQALRRRQVVNSFGDECPSNRPAVVHGTTQRNAERIDDMTLDLDNVPNRRQSAQSSRERFLRNMLRQSGK